MTIHQPIATPVFPDSACDAFAAAYPDRTVIFGHRLTTHPLLSRASLAALAERMPARNVEYNRGDLPLALLPEQVPANGLSIAETVRTIDTNGSWMALRNVECDPLYAELLDQLLAELEPAVRRRTGAIYQREAYIFLSSPGSITPFHMDPEHNILLQIEGEKVITIFPPGDKAMVSDEKSEAFHAGGHCNLDWDDSFAAKGVPHRLLPGDAVHVPVKAPHFVRNADRVSIGLSITWRSARSIAEGELHSLNSGLRRRRLPMVPIGDRPERQWAALTAHRIMRRLSRRKAADA